MDFLKWFFLSATKEERNNLLVLPTFFLLLFLAIIVCVTLKNYKSKNIGLFFSNIKKIIKNTRAIKKISLCYYWIPSLFRSIIPVTNQDQDYIIKIKWDKRELVEATKLELLYYYFLVFLYNMLLIIIVVMICNQVCPNSDNVFLVVCSFWISIAITQQFGAGYLFRARINSEAPFFVFNMMLNFSIYAIVSLLLAQAIGTGSKNIIIYWLDKLGIVYVIVVVLFQPIFNLVILPILQLLKRWKRSKLREKPRLLLTILLGTGYTLIIGPYIVYVVIDKYFSGIQFFPTYNLTNGYSQFFTLLIGCGTCLGIFIAVFDASFFGKHLSHYIFSLSKNNMMVLGIIFFITASFISFLIPLCRCVYYVIATNNGGKITSVINVIHIYSILAIVCIILSTVFFFIYFFQVMVLFKNYTGEEKNKIIKKLISYFGEIIAEDVLKLDLELDLDGQKYLISELINSKFITESEIVEILNTNSEFKNRDSENTVILAIIKYLNNTSETSTLNKNHLKKLEYIDVSLQTELEKLQKKYGVFTPQINEIELQTKTSENSFLKNLINGIFCKNKKSI